ncbi:histidine kinase/DNA gyrase B/HSP90-like ATPase [Ulvibacter antarcticus]|uniref:histidine kinase n=2 Tax=Ulvibacter antarcticus TaxID=442714 RepID=A0A3L9Z204_9FLAO|nr:histidine kinase/DNA gyrase B/HSP90-like ATPase [Ulvibacter antarcticus]
MLLFLGQILLFIDYIKSTLAEVEKSIDCLLYEDYTFTVHNSKQKYPLHQKTALLLEKYKKAALQQTSEQQIFTNIINSLSIGILMLRKDTDGKIDVYQLNDTFVDFLNIPKYYQWNLLKEKIKPIADIFQHEEWQKRKHVLSLKLNDTTETFYFKTAVTKTHEFDYLIVTMETIQQLIDKKEKESWYKLMNVMSHEIINTITPISSLAENLDSLLQEGAPNDETLIELSQGLNIIKRRSHHLTTFVDSYRKLAELPLPEKEIFNVARLIRNTISLFQPEFEEKKVNINLNASEKLNLSADKKQMEQILINLITNSIFAVSGTENPQIDIELVQKNNKCIISVSDNGEGIPKDIKEKIFIPYFTTRKNGSGIGLTLSKSMVESHNGTLFFSSGNGKTTFIVSLNNSIAI